MFYYNVLNLYEHIITQKKIYTKQIYFLSVFFFSYSFKDLEGLVVS